MSKYGDQTHGINLDCLNQLKIGQAGYLLKNPRIMFVSSSCETLPRLFKLCLWWPKMAPPRMSHVFLIEALHPVNFVNITHVKS